VIEALFIAALEAAGPVTTIASTRLYAIRRPEGEKGAAVVISRIGSEPVNSLGGYSGKDYARLEVTSYASTLLQAKQLAAAVRAAINAAGTLRALCTNEFDDQDTETREFLVVQEFNAWEAR
jgi:hypothetical protein